MMGGASWTTFFAADREGQILGGVEQDWWFSSANDWRLLCLSGSTFGLRATCDLQQYYNLGGYFLRIYQVFHSKCFIPSV